MKCFEGEFASGEGRCPRDATYVAKLHSNTAPNWYLCGGHAAEARAADDVERIASVRPQEAGQ